ncbi:L,D-transpeptidase family protein [Onishia taeanensis]
MGDVIDRSGRLLSLLVMGLFLVLLGVNGVAGAWAQALGAGTAPQTGQGATLLEVAGGDSPGEAASDNASAVDPGLDASLPPAAPLPPFEAYVRAASETMPHGDELLRLYEALGFREAWSDAERMKALASALEGLEADGLVVDDYRPAALSSAYREAHEAAFSEAGRWRVELAATKRLVLALRHLYLGKVDPARIDADWEIPLPAFTPDWSAIAEAISNGDPAVALELVRPGQSAYRQLREGLARYRRLQAAGGWAPLASSSGVLRPGDRAPEVIALRRRLAALGELELLMGVPATAMSGNTGEGDTLSAGLAADQVYDAQLVAAVKRFQWRHLLEVDGVVGPRTRAALGVSVNERVDQIRLNLERLRWLSHALPARYVLVDIAGYDVRYVRPSQPDWQSRVVVGQPYRRTPTLRSTITHMTFHPTWTVPPTILREDVLPAVRRDPFYLVRNDMRVLDRRGRPLDPWQVDWWRPGPIMVQQRAGPSNPLGDLVIRFPNRHLVYLHDTPSRSLFERARRPFSSGCIRVEGVRELVRLLFEDDRVSQGDPSGAARLNRALERAGTHNVSLRAPVPLFLYYSTVQAGADGRLFFRPDVYERDAAVLSALVKKGGENMFDAL